MKIISKTKGFSLIELVIVITILGIIFSMGGSLLLQGFNSYVGAKNINDATWQAQVASERMMRDLELVRSTADITTSTAANFAYTDLFGNTISYTLSGTSLTLTQNSSSQILADGIQNLAFTYYDKNGNTTTTANLISYIKFSFDVVQGGTNFTMTSTVYPRNLL